MLGSEGDDLDGPGGWLCVRGRKTGALGLKLGRERNGIILVDLG